jgi:hypothetical protein
LRTRRAGLLNCWQTGRCQTCGLHKDFISRYGFLKTNPDNSIIKVKTAYYAVQNVVSVFNDALAHVPDEANAVLFEDVPVYDGPGVIADG